MSTQKNKIKIKSKSRRIPGVEAYSSLVFRIIGIGLLVYSAYFYLSFQNEFLDAFFKSLFQTTDEVALATRTTSMGTYVKLLLRFVPVVLVSLFCFFTAKKYPISSYYLNLIAILTLTVLHAQLFFHKYFLYESCHTNYTITSLFLLVPVVVFFMNYWVHQRPLALTFISIYFYSFIFQLLIAHFDYGYVFGAILIYSLAFYLISQKQQHLKSTIINSTCAYGFLGIFVLRKLYVGRHESFLPLFFGVSFLYFLLFFIVSLSFSRRSKVLQYLFSWGTTFVYLVVNCLVLWLFFGSWYFLPILVALLFYGVSLYFASKLPKEATVTTLLELPTLLLLSSFVMTLWLAYAFELFFGSISVLLLLYYLKRDQKYLFWSSLVALQLLLLQFVYLVISFYIPALALFFNPISSQLEKGLVTSGLLLLSLFGVKRVLRSVKDKITTKWFNQRNYSQFLTLFFLATLFIFMEWICFSVLFLQEGTIVYFHSLFFIIGFIYCLYLLFQRYTLPPKYKSAISYTVYFFGFLMPIFGFIKFPYNFISRLELPHFLVVESVLHYLELFLCLLLLIKGFVVLHTKTTSKNLRRFFEISLSLVAILLLCKEYDYLFLLNNYTNSSAFDLSMLDSMLVKNRLLPYSSIILISAIILLLIGILNNDRFIRFFSLSIVGFSLVKIFYLEFHLLTEDERFGILVLLGFAFLLISWIYNKVKVKRRVGSRF